MPLVLLVILAIFVVSAVVGGWIGGFVAGRRARDRRVGFLLGALGGVGGWILAAVYPRDRSEMRGALTRLGVLACVAIGLILACCNLWYAVVIMLVVASPERFGWLAQ